MSSSFDTVQWVLSAVRDSSNLTAEQKELLGGCRDVIDEWHEVNHKLKDAFNRDSSVQEQALALLKMYATSRPRERLRALIKKGGEYYE